MCFPQTPSWLVSRSDSLNLSRNQHWTFTVDAARMAAISKSGVFGWVSSFPNCLHSSYLLSTERPPPPRLIEHSTEVEKQPGMGTDLEKDREELNKAVYAKRCAIVADGRKHVGQEPAGGQAFRNDRGGIEVVVDLGEECPTQ